MGGRLQTAFPSVVSIGPSGIQSARLPVASTSPPPSTRSAETIMDLLMNLDDDTAEDLSWTTNTNSTSLIPRDTVSSIDKIKLQRSLWVFFNSSGHGGYNLTIPGCLSPDLILGDGEFPNGTYVTNATLADLVIALSLPPQALYNYTLVMAQQIYDKINATLASVICEGAAGATRDLLWPPYLRPNYRDINNSEGFMSAFLVGVVGVTGIAWTGTHLAISGKWPTQNITIETEIAILAGTTMIETIFLTVLWRLQSVPKRWIGRAEARVLNAFIFVGELMLKGLERIQSNTCFSTATAQMGLSSLLERAQHKVQVFRFGYGPNINTMSGANLMEMGGNIDYGSDVAETAEAVTQIVIDGVLERQIEGNGQPGQSC